MGYWDIFLGKLYFNMDGEYYCCDSGLDNNDAPKVVNMTDLKFIPFILALLNLVAITVAVYQKKQSLALGLAILEIILVYLASII